ncbi:MAG: hypothetical protein ACYS8O_05120 [Planctomycetota bacterium]
MTVSEKQMLANQQNALRSTGPKTDQGKALASRNSLKHGLLAEEVVITAGEGAEDKHLVEKIAAAYWRQRRASRYEVGILRQKLDTMTHDYYRPDGRLTDAEIDNEIAQKQTEIKTAREQYQLFKRSRDSGQDVATSYHLKENWKRLKKQIIDPKDIVHKMDGYPTVRVGLTTEDSLNIKTPPQIHKKLLEKGHTESQIWQVHMDFCQKHMNKTTRQIKKLQADKADNKLHLQRIKKTSSLPPRLEMDNLLRYETAIERQMYQAIRELERLQRLRAGDHVPPPLQMDLNISDCQP